VHCRSVRRAVQCVIVCSMCLLVLIPGAAEAQVAIYPGTDIQAAVSGNVPGTRFVLKSGIHRMQTIRPRDGDVYTGEAGTVLSGARVLSGFSRSGSLWVIGGQTQQGTQVGVCRDTYPTCASPEDLFIDNQLMTRVGSLGQVGAGQWYFDYEADRIYIGNDPSGHLVETSITPAAFVALDSRVSGVTITGLVIEKYATPGNTGAISTPNAFQWMVSNNEIRFNHAGGITVGSGSQVLNNYLHHNGQVGIGAAGGQNVIIANNDVSYNGGLFFQYWGTGGIKLMGMRDALLQNNHAHHNLSGGLWCDGDCYNITFASNLVEDNEQFGIHYEISFNAVIVNNTVRRNGFGTKEGPGQSGIYVFASKNVEIYNNLVDSNAWGIVAWQENRGSSAVYGQPYELGNIYVHDNWMIMTSGINGLAQVVGDNSYYTSRNNRWVRNWYWMAPGVDFYWMNTHMSDPQWQSYGQDPGGTFWR
jgi:hypothetical protein